MSIKLFVATLWLSIAGQICVADEFDVYFLGGQSNMEGFGQVSDLPTKFERPIDGVFIFHATPREDQQPLDGQGNWSPLTGGHGTGFKHSAGKDIPSERFGIELSFASAMRELRPGRKIAIIKYARNGSSIADTAAGRWGCWEPDFEAESGSNRSINQYDQSLATIRNAFLPSDIDQDGTIDTLNPAGILWMQGESDAAHTQEVAERYAENLKRLMDLLRAALRNDDLPVAIGRISDSKAKEGGQTWKFGDVVRSEQAYFCESDSAAVLVTSTDNYAYSDPWHYDSEGYLDLGEQFAKALGALRPNP